MTETTDQTLLPPLPDPRAMNGVRHGILSELVPSWEREGYAAHVQSVRDSTGASSYLQQRLADRAALALWRLDRVARWEAVEMETDRRRFEDGLHAQQPDYAALLSDAERRPVDTRNLRDSLQALAVMTGETQGALLRHPETVEMVATDLELEAAAWASLEKGGDPASLNPNQAVTIGYALLDALEHTWGVGAARLARVMLGSKPTRADVEAVTDGDWDIEPLEGVALVGEAVRAAGDAWRLWVLERQYNASGKAGKLRAVNARLPLLMEQERARALEPDVKRLEKIARYEAHLERVLYRSLRELRELEESDHPSVTPNE